MKGMVVERDPPTSSRLSADLAHRVGPRERRNAARPDNSRQNWRRRGTRSCGRFPAMIAAFIAPIAVPAIQFGRALHFSRAA